MTVDELVRATTPANTLDVSATGEAGLDFDNVKVATGATTLTNITVPAVTAVTNDVGITQAGADKVWGSAGRSLTDKADFALSSVSRAAVADDVWDEAISGHLGVGSVGEALDNAGAAGTPPTVAEIADGVWDELISGHVGVGSAGESLDTAASASGATPADIWAYATRALTDKADFALSSAAVANLVNEIWGAGTRTLSSFGTLVSDVASAVWAAATRTLSAFGFTVATNSDANVTAMKAVIDTNLDMAISDVVLNPTVNASVVLPVSVAQRVAMGKVEIDAGLTYRFSFTSTYAGDLSAATKLWYAIKERDVEDANGLILIEETTGLTVVNRTAYGTAAHGSISVTGSAGDWTISVYVDEIATSLLSDHDGLNCLSGVKALVGGDAVSLRDDECVVRLATVRAIS